jgi:short-subunit dehydrogenase
MKINDTLAVITGASSGIGAATARALAARGARVALLARDRVRLGEVAAEIASGGGKAHVYPLDLTDAQAISVTCARIREEVGVPDILVNNAGAGRWLPIVDTSAADAAQMMAVPFLAAFNVTREFLPAMLARGSGQVINVTSVSSRLAWPGNGAYSAARWALEGFTAALRADIHGTGLGVTLAMFGTVESPYWEHNPGSRERLPAPAARLRAITPDEAADAIVRGIETNRRFVLKPGIFRLFFLLDALFPVRTEALMCAPHPIRQPARSAPNRVA